MLNLPITSEKKNLPQIKCKDVQKEMLQLDDG